MNELVLTCRFTKIPSLRLAPDRRAKLISGYEEYPFDQAVLVSSEEYRLT